MITSQKTKLLEKNTIRLLFLILFSLFISTSTHAQFLTDGGWSDIREYPGINILKEVSTDATIPGEYSFYPRFSDQISYVRSDGKNIASTVTVKQGDWILVKKAGRYNGIWIDMKVTFWSSNIKNGTNTFYTPTKATGKADFLRINNGAGTKQRSVFKYEFFYAGTQTPISVAGFWNLYRINNLKAANIPEATGVYVLNPKKETDWQLSFKKLTNAEYPNGDCFVVGKKAGEGDWSNVTYTFPATTSFYRIIQVQAGAAAYTKYDVNGLTKIEFPAPAAEDGSANFPSAKMNVNQLIPPLAMSFGTTTPAHFYTSQYTLMVDLDEVITDAKAVVTNTDNATITYMFNQTFNNNILSINAISSYLSSNNFYDQDIEFQINAKIDKTKNYKKYLDGEYLKIPMKTTQVGSIVDYNKSWNSSTSATMTIWYPFPDGTVSPRTYKLGNVPDMTTQSFLSSCFSVIKDGATNSTLSLVSKPSDEALKTVGFAGYARIKITSNISGEEIIKDVPINIIDDNVIINGDYALAASSFQKSLSDFEGDVTAFLNGGSKVKAWKVSSGDDCTDDLTISDGGFSPNFKPGTYQVVYTLDKKPNGWIQKQITAKIIDTQIKFVGRTVYNEGEKVDISITRGEGLIGNAQWFFPNGTQVTSAVGDNLIVNNAQNNQSGYYTVKIGDISAKVFVSIAPRIMYWNPTATDSDWNKTDNWLTQQGAPANAIPYTKTKAYIGSKAANYPDLELTDYTKFGDATVDVIAFLDRAMLNNQHKLTYNNAEIEVNFKESTDRGRWVMYSAPLRKVYTGDYMLVKDDKPIKKAIYMSFFQSANPDNDLGSNAHKQYAKDRTFTKTFGNVGVLLGLGKPFNIWINKVIDKTTPFRFPSMFADYDYFIHGVWSQDPTGEGNSGLLDRKENSIDVSGRFITEDVKSTWNAEGAFTITPPDDDEKFNMVMIPNPFMAYLDIQKFLEANSDYFKSEYKLWNGKDAFITYKNDPLDWNNESWVVSDNSALDETTGFIPPLQSFIVAKKSNVKLGKVIKYDPKTMTTTKAGQSSGYELRQSKIKNNKHILYITAEHSGFKNSAMLINSPKSSNEYEHDDAPKLFYDNTSGGTSISVYTLTPKQKTLDINLAGDYTKSIPLGIRFNGKGGEMKLKFEGIDSFGYNVYLYDAQKKTEINLASTNSYSIDIDNTNAKKEEYCEINDRLSLRFKSTTGIGDEKADAEIVNIKPMDNKLLISYDQQIQSVELISPMGHIIYKNSTPAKNYSITNIYNSLYIVKIQLHNKTIVQKIMNKQ